MTETKTALDLAREATRAKREAGEAIERLDPIEKARRKPTSLRLAVNAKCAQCVCWHGDANPRRRIRDCGVPSCSLYPLRPYQRGDDEGAGESESGGEG